MLLINLEDDFIEKFPYEMAEEVFLNKARDIRFEYKCPSCENRLTARINNIVIVCSNCGGLMKHVDVSLVKFREKMNLTQEEFAEKIGVSRNYISMIESGKRPITSKIKKLLQIKGNK